jgi:hypothetical protein
MYGVLQGESAVLQERVPYMKLHRYKQRYPQMKLNVFENNGKSNFEVRDYQEQIKIKKKFKSCNFNTCT